MQVSFPDLLKDIKRRRPKTAFTDLYILSVSSTGWGGGGCIRGAGASAWRGSTCGGASLGLSCGSPRACGIIHEAVPLGYVSIKAPSSAAGRAGLDGMGMGSGQKIHDGGSEEMVKDMGVGGGGARWMACLGEGAGGEGKGGQR